VRLSVVCVRQILKRTPLSSCGLLLKKAFRQRWLWNAAG